MVNTIFGLFFNMQISLFLGVLLSLLCVPYYFRTKLWDTVIFIGFMAAINLTAALNSVPGCKLQ
jgi:hypothetical protein